MNRFANRTLYRIPAALLSVVVIYSAMDKFLFGSEKVILFANTAYNEYIVFLGISDLILLGLFLLRVTSRIGFIFSVCYYSAALSLRITSEAALIEPLAILKLLYVAMFFRDPDFFFPAKNSTQDTQAKQ